jgi:two-component system phosphate regulon sensor histidine kinase PhoR
VKKKGLWLITALMTLALLGVFVMQLYYIRESYKLKSTIFEQNVNQALSAVVTKVQKQNAINHINKKDKDFKINRHQGELDRAKEYVDLRDNFNQQEEKRNQEKYRLIQENLNYQEKLIRLNFGDAIGISEEEYLGLQSTTNSDLVFFFKDIMDKDGNLNSRIASLRYNPKRSTFNLTPSKLPDTVRYLVQDPRNLKPLVVSFATVDISRHWSN